MENAYLGTTLMAFQNMKDILKGSKNIQNNKLVIYKEMRIRMETDFSSAKLNLTVEKKSYFKFQRKRQFPAKISRANTA